MRPTRFRPLESSDSRQDCRALSGSTMMFWILYFMLYWGCWFLFPCSCYAQWEFPPPFFGTQSWNGSLTQKVCRHVQFGHCSSAAREKSHVPRIDLIGTSMIDKIENEKHLTKKSTFHAEAIRSPMRSVFPNTQRRIGGFGHPVSLESLRGGAVGQPQAAKH